MTDRPDDSAPHESSRDRQIDAFCDRFEAACHDKDAPRLEDFLSQVDEPSREAALGELLRVELELRRGWGESPAVAEYQQRFPDHLALVAEAFQLTDHHRTATNIQGQTPVGQGLHIRCPHCHNAVEIIADAPLVDITCSSCGSHFSLVGERVTTRTAPTVTEIGHFELIERLGVGGFGTVWKARDTVLDRSVAVKIPRKGQLEPAELDQFLREARTSAQLRHPNIVSVYEVGREGDTVYIVSDIVRGLPLSDWLTGQRPTAREAARLCIKIAEALNHAHQAGVIHRDLKPQNIMIDDDGEPHLMDFGLARREAGEITVTVDGQVMGTPAYMSPEQAQGEAHTADRRTDIYSLGVILFELLTGELPFRGNARMLIYQVINEDAPSPRRLNSTVPKDLETICLKCLEKAPARRYATAGDVAEELQRFLAGEPIQARPLTHVARGWRWCKRKPMAAAVVGLLLVISVFTPLVALREVSLREEAVEARAQMGTTLIDMSTSMGLIAAEHGDSSAAALWFANATSLAQHDAKRELANHLRFRVWSQTTPTPLAAFFSDALDNSGYRAVPGDKLTFSPGGKYLLVESATSEATLLNVITQSNAKNWSNFFPARAAEWRPDGKWIAIVSPDGHVQIREFPSSRLVHEFADIDAARDVAFSGDGERLAIAGTTTRVWDCREEQFFATPLSSSPRTVRLVLNKNGDRLITTHFNNTARVYAIGGGANESQPLFAPVDHVSRYRPVFLLDDSRILFFPGEAVELRDATSGQVHTSIPVSTTLIRHVAASPSGQHFVIAEAFSARLFDASTGLPTGKRVEHANQIYKCVFSPEGRLLMTVGGDRVVKFHSVPAFEEVWPALPHLHTVVGGAFSGDGLAFATMQGDGLIRVWSPPRDISPRVVANSHFARLNSDGSHLVRAGCPMNRSLTYTEVIDTSTGERVGQRCETRGLLNDAAFYPDGTRLVTLCSLEENRNQTNYRTIKWWNQEGWVQFWDFSKGKEVHPAIRTPSEPVYVDIHADGQLAVVICAAGGVLMIDLETGRDVRTISRLHRPQFRYSLHRGVWFTPDGKRFIIANAGMNIEVWNTRKMTLETSLRKKDNCHDVDVSPDGQLLAAASTLDKTATVWLLETGELAAPPMVHPGWVFSSRFSSDGRRLLTSCRDGMARLWDWRTGELVCSPFRHDDEVFHAVFSADGKWIITASRDGSARIWDPLTGKPITPPLNVGGRIHDVAVAPNGRHAVVSGNVVAVIDLADLLRSDHRNATDSKKDILMSGEIVAGRRIHKQSDIANLTSREWFDRWTALRQNDSYEIDNEWLASGDSTSTARIRRTVDEVASDPSYLKKYAQDLLRDVDSLMQERNYQQATKKLLVAAEMSAEDAGVQSFVAWDLLTCPDERFRHVDRALEFAQHATELLPESGLAWQVLGSAEYRKGNWQASIAALERSMELQGDGGDDGQWFVLSMAHWQLGQKDEARNWYDRASKRMDENGNGDVPEGIKSFGKEAVELLGVEITEPKLQENTSE